MVNSNLNRAGYVGALADYESYDNQRVYENVQAILNYAGGHYHDNRHAAQFSTTKVLGDYNDINVALQKTLISGFYKQGASIFITKIMPLHFTYNTTVLSDEVLFGPQLPAPVASFTAAPELMQSRIKRESTATMFAIQLKIETDILHKPDAVKDVQMCLAQMSNMFNHLASVLVVDTLQNTDAEQKQDAGLPSTIQEYRAMVLRIRDDSFAMSKRVDGISTLLANTKHRMRDASNGLVPDYLIFPVNKESVLIGNKGLTYYDKAGAAGPGRFIGGSPLAYIHDMTIIDAPKLPNHGTRDTQLERRTVHGNYAYMHRSGVMDPNYQAEYSVYSGHTDGYKIFSGDDLCKSIFFYEEVNENNANLFVDGFFRLSEDKARMAWFNNVRTSQQAFGQHFGQMRSRPDFFLTEDLPGSTGAQSGSQFLNGIDQRLRNVTEAYMRCLCDMSKLGRNAAFRAPALLALDVNPADANARAIAESTEINMQPMNELFPFIMDPQTTREDTMDAFFRLCGYSESGRMPGVRTDIFSVHQLEVSLGKWLEVKDASKYVLGFVRFMEISVRGMDATIKNDNVFPRFQHAYEKPVNNIILEQDCIDPSPGAMQLPNGGYHQKFSPLVYYGIFSARFKLLFQTWNYLELAFGALTTPTPSALERNEIISFLLQNFKADHFHGDKTYVFNPDTHDAACNDIGFQAETYYSTWDSGNREWTPKAKRVITTPEMYDRKQRGAFLFMRPVETLYSSSPIAVHSGEELGVTYATPPTFVAQAEADTRSTGFFMHQKFGAHAYGTRLAEVLQDAMYHREEGGNNTTVHTLASAIDLAERRMFHISDDREASVYIFPIDREEGELADNPFIHTRGVPALENIADMYGDPDWKWAEFFSRLVRFNTVQFSEYHYEARNTTNIIATTLFRTAMSPRHADGRFYHCPSETHHGPDGEKPGSKPARANGQCIAISAR